MQTVLNRLKVFSSEFVLGSLVAILSIIAAISGYQNAMADSNQTKYNVQGQQMLTDANAKYLTANQMVGYDYIIYDGWYTTEDEEESDYYQRSMSEALQAAINANPEDPFTDVYYTAMYAEPQAMFDEASALFAMAQKFGGRGDALQLILMISALGLTLAAWASLLDVESPVRVFFGISSTAMLIYSAILYLTVPEVVV